jgi:hypothetical protein
MKGLIVIAVLVVATPAMAKWHRLPGESTIDFTAARSQASRDAPLQQKTAGGRTSGPCRLRESATQPVFLVAGLKVCAAKSSTLA